ncbi:MAG: ABC transporter ATP-binding protein [Oscillospiraceae bacterium]|nr:ABC transporter ATP-binding protein [Oscillospiraceae bacterium]
MAFIEFDSVNKDYIMGEVTINALKNASFGIERGEFAVILGSSGAGKTTALNILGGMDSVTGGRVIIDDKEIQSLTDKQLVSYRRNDVGFVFQFYNLVPNLTALENIELASQICKDSLDPREVLNMVGLADRADNFPSQLSGGEQQRVTIARAIAKNPKLLLCDEPTGALDSTTGKQILQLLYDTCIERKVTVVLITHNVAISPVADRIIRFRNGTVYSIETNDTPMSVETVEW